MQMAVGMGRGGVYTFMLVLLTFKTMYRIIAYASTHSIENCVCLTCTHARTHIGNMQLSFPYLPATAYATG